MTFLDRLLRREPVPAEVASRLEGDERVVAMATVAPAGRLVVTTWGIWTPGDVPERIGWHEIAKATWEHGALVVIPTTAREVGAGTVLLTDRPARRFRLDDPGRVPQTVHERVTGSIRSRSHRDLPRGGAWVLQRKVPGRDGMLMQVWPDPETDPDAVEQLALGVAQRIGEAR
ncbi:hypothetical protein [Pseudonocardia endophytica]|uniref:Uncharacterized protein n=1 Tax=Pseudonocardia endophytica TaxID=401976 RepID=A0A4R1HGF5_PSEEN|nr:hypothetical protein [Pseudonocardia endophytica]TCK21254.1 hypothetical protein EV378_5234 [Pseudonocardia endophytica]